MKSIVLAVAAAAAATAAHAEVHIWDWHVSDGPSVNHNGGQFEAIHAEFDTVTDRLLWQITFADQVTDGYTLALNDGPNPKGHAGELALVYFDATDIANVRVTTYAYNGLNALTSFRDGSPIGGDQTADLIFAATSFEEHHPAIINASAQDVGLGRVLTLEMDASIINGHAPKYPGPDGEEEWFGIGFGEMLGLWLHPMRGLTTGYDQDGRLNTWSGQQGWFDGSNQLTVPTPGVIALGAISGGLLSRRRRS